MFKNTLKIIWRNLLKDRFFTALNLLGLSTGLACALLIGLWVNDERAVDKYNAKDSQLYQVLANQPTNDGIKTLTSTPGLLSQSLATDFPEVAYATAVLPASWFPFHGVIAAADTRMKAAGQYVSKDYFNVFTLDFEEGDQKSLFAGKSSVAISETFAKKLFNTTRHLVGKTIEWNQSEFRTATPSHPR